MANDTNGDNLDSDNDEPPLNDPGNNPSSTSSEDNDDDNNGFTTVNSKKKTRKNGSAKATSKSENMNPYDHGGSVLHFPWNCELSDDEKREWLSDICDENDLSDVRWTRGRNRLFAIVNSRESIIFLTSVGAKGIKLYEPKPMQRTKIIIKNVPLSLNLQELENHLPSATGIRRNKIRGVESPQVIAFWEGEAPNKLVIGREVFPVSVFVDLPMLCYKCSKWGHVDRNCRSIHRCRFCAGHHNSQLCIDKIKKGEKFEPKCVNCGSNHNASAKNCPKRPKPVIGNENQGNSPLNTQAAPSSNVTNTSGPSRTTGRRMSRASHQTTILGDSNHDPVTWADTVKQSTQVGAVHLGDKLLSLETRILNLGEEHSRLQVQCEKHQQQTLAMIEENHRLQMESIGTTLKSIESLLIKLIPTPNNLSDRPEEVIQDALKHKLFVTKYSTNKSIWAAIDRAPTADIKLKLAHCAITIRNAANMIQDLDTASGPPVLTDAADRDLFPPSSSYNNGS